MKTQTAKQLISTVKTLCAVGIKIMEKEQMFKSFEISEEMTKELLRLAIIADKELE